MKRFFNHYLNSHSRQAQFMRFATVGVKISLIDAALLYSLPHFWGVNLYLARVVSLSSAIMAGYLLNRYFTFGGHERGCFYRQMAGHFGVHLTGGLINYGVFSGMVAVGIGLITNRILLTALPLISMWTGGAIGMVFNYTFSSRLVFRRKSGAA